MDKTFVTIHNLAPSANILFASDSITDVLDYEPEEILGRSCFDYFHPDEVPFARSIYKKGVLLDKAAVLHYTRIKSKRGQWIGCECVFTIVYDVLVASTSVYHAGERSQRRAFDASQIRRIFSCSPRDPRYHMLEYLSPKFRTPHQGHEPRAAMILNRFSRSLPIMYASEAVTSILGLGPEQMLYKSFYECIQEPNLPAAIKCLENAKANDSIAYLRFMLRDPRRPEDFRQHDAYNERGETERSAVEHWLDDRDLTREDISETTAALRRWASVESDSAFSAGEQSGLERSDARPIDYARGRDDADGDASMSDNPPLDPEHSQHHIDRRGDLRTGRSAAAERIIQPMELEAVVSCTSDGLVVVLRQARARIPGLEPPREPSALDHGLFAAPWSPAQPSATNVASRTLSLTQDQRSSQTSLGQTSGGPDNSELMASIREIAVFVWALVGINGTMADHSQGLPTEGAQPWEGLPIWDATAGPTDYRGPENPDNLQRVPRLGQGLEELSTEGAFESKLFQGPQSHSQHHAHHQARRPSRSHLFPPAMGRHHQQPTSARPRLARQLSGSQKSGSPQSGSQSASSNSLQTVNTGQSSRSTSSRQHWSQFTPDTGESGESRSRS